MKSYWIVVPGPRGVNGSDVKTVCCPHISSIGAAKAAHRAAAEAEASRLRLCLPMRFEADDSCNELFCCHWVWQDLALAMIDGPGAPPRRRVARPPGGRSGWRPCCGARREFLEVGETTPIGQAVEMPSFPLRNGAIRHYMIFRRLRRELTMDDKGHYQSQNGGRLTWINPMKSFGVGTSI